ncbi:15044_t:CDS:2 [Rhizophagus irregularis]|nr:15044_t:CDS:2 [Rhizophagus irregularis]
MSVDAISEDAGIISRLQLAKALKEDPENIYAESPENSAIFLRQRNRNTRFGTQTPPRGAFRLPRPTCLLVPPVLAQQEVRRPSIPQISTSSPRNSIIIPEDRERRGSGSKPATLLDVRESMLEVRQNLQNTLPFSASSSHRTSMILQQNKSLPDANGKPHGSSKLSNVTASRPNSVISPSRPISSSKSKSQKSGVIKKNGSSSSDDSDSAPKQPPMLPPIKSVANQAITSPRITTKKSNGGRIEAWLEHVSGSPEGIPSRPSTPVYIPEDLQPPKPEFHQPRKRSNSEFAPKKRPISFMHDVPLPVGRVSPSPRQDSGYWAKDTLLALSDDLRHMSIMNDSNALYSRTRSASFSNPSGSGNIAKLSPANNISKVMNRHSHRREGSSSSAHNSRPSTPQLQIPPIVKPSRSKDSLQTPPMSPYSSSTMNGNRNSFYANNQRISSEQSKVSNRNSFYLHQHQQKNRIRS